MILKQFKSWILFALLVFSVSDYQSFATKKLEKLLMETIVKSSSPPFHSLHLMNRSFLDSHSYNICSDEWVIGNSHSFIPLTQLLIPLSNIIFIISFKFSFKKVPWVPSSVWFSAMSNALQCHLRLP